MFRTHLRKIRGDLTTRKSRTLLVSLAIFVGVAGTVALFSMGDILVSQIEKDIQVDKVSMVNVLVTVNRFAKLNNDAYLNNLREMQGVTAVQASTQSTTDFKLHPDDPEYEVVNVISYSRALDELEIEPLRLEQGRLPNEGADEVAVERRFAERYGVGVGDTLYLRVLSPSHKPTTWGRLNTVEAWTVTGIVFHAYSLAPSRSIYVQPRDNSYLTATKGYNVFSARYTSYSLAHGRAKTFTAFLADNTPYFPIFTQRQDPAQNPLTVGARRLSETMSFLAFVALFVSGFLVVNVINSIMVEQKRQIGVMKSLGALREECFLIYCGLALACGIIGVIPGLIVGIPAGYYMADELASQVNTSLPGFRVSPSSIAIGFAAGLLVPVLAAIIPVWDGTRVTILEAVSDTGIKATYTKGLVANFIDLLPLPISIQQALRNINLKRIRMSLTILTLATAVGSFMGILAVFNSVHLELARFLENFDPNFAIAPTLDSDPEYVLALLEYQLREQAVTANIQTSFQLPVQVEGYESMLDFDPLPDVTAYGYDVSGEFHTDVQEGEPLTKENAGFGVVISSRLANQLDRQVGDRVSLDFVGNAVEFVIVGIMESPLEQVWMSQETLLQAAGYADYLPKPNEYLSTLAVEGYESAAGSDLVRVVGLDASRQDLFQFTSGQFFNPDNPGVIMSEDMAAQGGYVVGDFLTLKANGDEITVPIVGIFRTPDPSSYSLPLPQAFIGMNWEDLAALENRTLDDIPLPRTYLLTTLESLSEDEYHDLISRLDERLEEIGIPSTLFDFVGLLEALSANLRTFQAVLSAVALLIGIVGALGLLSTLSMSIFERQKEIGIMRSIGADSKTIILQFLTEGMVVGCAAWLLGLPFGYVLSLLILDVTGLNQTIGVVFSIQAALVGLVGVMLLTIVASLGPSISASRRTVSDILRYQ